MKKLILGLGMVLALAGSVSAMEDNKLPEELRTILEKEATGTSDDSTNLDHTRTIADWLYNRNPSEPLAYISQHVQGLHALSINGCNIPVDINRVIAYLMPQDCTEFERYQFLCPLVETTNQELKQYLRDYDYNTLVAHWLEKNFTNPVEMVQTESGYLINIYGINIPNPEAVISILKGKPFNLDTFYITDQSSRYFNSSVEYWTNIKKQFPYFFSFSNNSFCEFPLDCWQVIKSMKQLREINLDMNFLAELPLDRWYEIASMKQLRSLNLSENNLAELSLDCWQVIASMKQLRKLDLGHNYLNELPLDCWQVITSMTHLRSLDLRDNYLNKLPESDSRIQLIRGMEQRGVKVLI